MEYDSILFDLDGTLWNATEAIAVSWAQALREAPDVETSPTVEQLKSVMGMTSSQLMATLFPWLSAERGQELFEQCCQVENRYLRQHGALLYPEEEKTLKELSKSYPLFIVSNCNDGYIECFLDAHHMRPLFQDWECIGRSGLQKWENIQLIVQRNGLSKPIYVGDTTLDYEAACRAGVPFLHAGYGFGQVPDVPQVSCFSRLLAFF